MLVSVVLTLVASPQDGAEKFRQDVLPVLQAKCFSCHGDDQEDVRGEFDIRSRAGLLRGGESGRAAVVPMVGEQFISGTEVTGWVISIQVPADTYDLVITNPDGQTDRLPDAVLVP